MRREESAYQNMVMKYAKMTGHLVFHDYDSRRNEPGFPDLVIVPDMTMLTRNPTLRLWELKSSDGRVSREQAKWLRALQRVRSVETRVVRPGDWEWVQATLQDG